MGGRTQADRQTDRYTALCWRHVVTAQKETLDFARLPICDVHLRLHSVYACPCPMKVIFEWLCTAGAAEEMGPRLLRITLPY